MPGMKGELRKAIMRVLSNAEGLPAESVADEILDTPEVADLLAPPVLFFSTVLLWRQHEAGKLSELEFYRSMRKIMLQAP